MPKLLRWHRTVEGYKSHGERYEIIHLCPGYSSNLRGYPWQVRDTIAGRETYCGKLADAKQQAVQWEQQRLRRRVTVTANLVAAIAAKRAG